MTRKIKLVAADLDGTIIDKQKKLSKKALKAIKALKRSGIKFILASGRHYCSLLPYAKRFKIDLPLIACNGAVVYNLRTKKAIFYLPVPRKYTKEIINYSKKRGFHINLYGRDKIYIREMSDWGILYRKRTKTPMVVIKDENKMCSIRTAKLLIVSSPRQVDRELKILKKKYKNKLSVMKTYPEYLEFMNKKVSKGSALKIIMKNLKINKDEAMAVGDSYNDIDMFKACGMKAAVRNACKELRKGADYTTKAKYGDGFAEAVNKFVL